MRKKFLVVLTFSLVGCGNHSSPAAVVKTQGAPTSGTDEIGAQAYASYLVSLKFDGFLKEVISAVDRLHSANSAAPQDQESAVSAFEQHVAAASNLTEDQLIALQDEGVDVQSKVDQAWYMSLKQSSARADYTNDLAQAYQKLERACDAGNYEPSGDKTENPELVKEDYLSGCSLRMTSVSPIALPTPVQMTPDLTEEMRATAAVWSSFEGKDLFSSQEFDQVVKYAANLLAYDGPAAKFDPRPLKDRIAKAQDKILALIIQYRHKKH